MSPSLRPDADGVRYWIDLDGTPIGFVRPEMLEKLAAVERQEGWAPVELRPVVEVR